MTLDRQTADRLAADRALGELAPDVVALHDAYLAHDADARRLADRTLAAVRTASQALDAVPYAAPERSSLWRGLARPVAGLAASLLLGLGLGLWLADRPTTPAPVEPAPVALRTPSAEPVESESFWSVRRLYGRRAASRPAPALIWDSPVTRPRIGEPS